MRIFPALISIILTPLVTLTPVLAQSPETAPSLELRVLESSAPDHLAVAVTDAAGQRVSDATVVLRLPTGAFFSNASESATAQTDANGVAEFQGIQWGPGGTVRLTASKGSAHAGLLIEKPPVSNAPAATQPVAAPPPPVAPEPAAPAPVQTAQPKRPPQPGVVVENDDSPYANVPIRTAVAEAEGGFTPKMSIVSNGKSSADHHMRNRILMGAAVAAGAGAAFFLTHNMHSGSSSSSGISVGSPTVSVGHP